MADGLSRRTVLHGFAASAVAAGSVSLSASPASATSRPKVPDAECAAFDREIRAAFDTLGNVGGAVAVVSADEVLHTATFGVRALQWRPTARRHMEFVGYETVRRTAGLRP
jgi:CubicO group peptidase (beta-lactamase class C family)